MCPFSGQQLKAFRQKVKHIVNNSGYGAKVKAEKLAPIVRGWRITTACKMDGSLSLYTSQNRAFKANKETKQNRYKAQEIVRQSLPAVSLPENKHINVLGNKSPYDGDLTKRERT